MNKSVVAVRTVDAFLVLAGEPILDTDEGVLIIAFDDGSARTFNWRYIIDFYPLTSDEVESLGDDLEDYL